jgi:fructokinase
MDIVTLGELLIDMFPAELGRRLADVSAFRPKPGGAPANVAVAAARLGAETAFIGKVGDDAFGYHLKAVLDNEGVETRGMRFDAEARTTMAFIAMIDENTPEFVFYRNPGADIRLHPDELDANLLQNAKALHFGSLSLTHEPARSATYKAIEWARSGGAFISYDVNYRPSLWRDPENAIAEAQAILSKVDVVKVNETELALLTGQEEIARDLLGEAAQRLLAEGPALCVITLGPNGSYFQTAEGGAYLPAFPVKTVDSVGCGDGFAAALLARLVSGPDWRAHLTVKALRDILRYANAVGALTATRQGVIPALPTAEEVETFLRESD